MKTVLSFEDVRFAYPATETKANVVEGLTFKVTEGEFMALVGNNGAGKTTTSKLMNGLLKPTAGTVSVDGVPTDKVRTSEVAKKIGMLFQDPDKQICKNTVFDEIAFGLQIRGISEDEMAVKVSAIIEEFGFNASAVPYTLSRGERQLLALASVIVGEPEVLILDEPTTGLDYRECTHIMERAKELNRAGTTIIMISHDMELVFDHVGRVMAMANGRIVADGAPERVFRNREAMAAASLLPPQIMELSMRLAQEPVNGRAFASVATPSDMVQILGACGFRQKQPERCFVGV